MTLSTLQTIVLVTMPNPNGNAISLRPKLVGSLSRGSKRCKISEALDLQEDLKKIAKDPTEKALARTAAARVWKELGLFVLSLRGVGLPAPVKSESKPRKGRSGPLAPVRVAEPEQEPIKPSAETGLPPSSTT